jgi:phospholipid transport system substrate-binding protein
MEVIRDGMTRALDIIRSCKPGEHVSVRGHREEIEEIVDDYIDFREMAMRTLGRHWKKQPQRKQEEFVKLFEELLFNAYVDRVDTYTCDGNEQVAYDSERIEGKYALVKTRVVGYKDTDVTVDYRLKLKSNGWRVYDVVVEGISLVNNYRSQFSSILSRESFDGLLNQMRQKIASR